MSDNDGETEEEAELFETPVGTRLREAREGQGIALEDIAKRTRIPLRQLENIDKSDYDRLPAPTYSTGFVKAYASAVGLDPNEIARAFREEIDYRKTSEKVGDYFEPADPARVPPVTLAWTAGAIAIVLIIAYAIWRSGLFGLGEDDRARIAAGTDQAAVEAEAAEETDTADTIPTDFDGPVVLTAESDVWLRISERDTGERIFEAEMAAGDRFEIPDTAQNPVLQTGRADAIRITVDGRAVDPVGPADTVVSDVSLAAADLVRPRSFDRQEAGDETAPLAPR